VCATCRPPPHPPPSPPPVKAVDAKRARLLEEVIKYKGNIRVFARVRPLLPSEDGEAASAARGPLIQFPDARDDASSLLVVEAAGTGVGGYGVGEPKRTAFELNRCFTPLSSQEDVWAEVEPVVQSALDGHRVTILCYGQTGSGKTHTTFGAKAGAGRGLVPRAVESVFERLAALAAFGFTHAVTVEVLEIYNEELVDLLAPRGKAAAAAAAPALDIRHDAKTGATTVTGLTVVPARAAADVLALLDGAMASRASGATASNAHSSRSHAVFTLKVALEHRATAQARAGVINICDLAGSERLAKSGAASDDRLLKETQHINKSLSILTQTIMAVKQSAPHVPFRSSKLTYLLQSSLGAACKTLLICNVSPAFASSGESLCTLRFAKSIAEVGAPAAAKAAAAAAATAAAAAAAASGGE